MKTIAIVLSGGKGLRFGTDLPKQYIEICNKPVLAYTLDAFQKSRVDEIVIVSSAEHQERCRKIAGDFGCSKVTSVIEGGKERYDSVLQGLRNLPPEEEAIVLIHDGARPCIRPEIINQILDSVSERGATIAGTPCTDTIKILDSDGNIRATTQRRLTWAAQTPQAFFMQEIREAYEQVIGDSARFASDETGQQITDDAMVYQMAFPEKPVCMIDAGSSNIKITNAADLDRAQSILFPWI